MSNQSMLIHRGPLAGAMLLRELVLGLAMVLVVLSPGRAAALVCGDGELDVFEQCDDGNLVAGDCCSPLCLIEPAGTECRPSTGPCDPAEFCTGLTGGCPNDLIRSDTDGDAVCDEDDVCPAVPDPGQADTDGDGIGDACDVCTTVPGVEIDRARLEMFRVSDPEGDEKIKIRGSAEIAEMPALDPMHTGFLIQFVDGMGGSSLDVTLPGQPIDRFTKTGWRARNGRSWRYRGGQDPIGGIETALIKVNPNDPQVVRFVILGRNGTYRPPAAAPVTLSLGFRGAVPAPGQCPQITFQEDGVGPRCQFTYGGSRFVCR